MCHATAPQCSVPPWQWQAYWWCLQGVRTWSVHNSWGVPGHGPEIKLCDGTHETSNSSPSPLPLPSTPPHPATQIHTLAALPRSGAPCPRPRGFSTLLPLLLPSTQPMQLPSSTGGGAIWGATDDISIRGAIVRSASSGSGGSSGSPGCSPQAI